MKISKQTREEAALICAIAASGGVYIGGSELYSHVYSDIRDALDASADALYLAVTAWCLAKSYEGWTREVDAECEALLRTGWSP